MQLTASDPDDRGLTRPLTAGIRQARVLVVGLLPMEGEVGELVEAGGAGFSSRQVSFEEFLQTARLVADGVAVLPPELTAALLRGITEQPAPVPGRAAELQATAQLTQRERQVMELIGAGFSNKEIAIRLRVAVHTVKTHVHNVLSKLSLGTRLEVAALLHSGKYRPAETITAVA